MKSAEQIVPIVLELVKPKSVIDVGCGDGGWLTVFKKYGIQDIYGVDGNWVSNESLLIEPSRFIAYDLRRPFQMNRKFDLVVAVEVAEHLPPSNSETFVNSLTRLGDVILFSAAIPFQVGQGHLNGQWPIFWANKFERNGFKVVDCIRQKIWNNSSVRPYYAQNIFVYVRLEALDKYPLLREALLLTNTSFLSVVHPKIYLQSVIPTVVLVLNIISSLPFPNRIRDWARF